jgi:hypothetical protein
MTPTSDRLAIREVIENWVVWRDAGDWERFLTVWHDEGQMIATWFQGSAAEFIAANRQGWARGVRILHSLGGTSIDLVGPRATAQTKMTIAQRAAVDGVECDVVCTGRFYDFFERRDDRWAIMRRQPIYERDRLDPVEPGALLRLDQARLARWPASYRHLAYLQEGLGYAVKRDMPELTGEAVEALYAAGERWLAGGPIDDARP